MPNEDCLATVRAWVEAANRLDIAHLLELSDVNIEVVGPRGSGFGHQLLRDWLARAGLTLETHRAFARGETVVLEQRGIWRAIEGGEVTGERPVASVFRVHERHVVYFARYDSLDVALAAAALIEADAVQ